MATHQTGEREYAPAQSSIEIVRAYNRWRRGDNGEVAMPASPFEIGIAIAEVVRLASQAKCLRAQLQGIKARIEDSPYYGRTAPRGAVKELMEIADAAHNALETAANIKP